MKFDLSNIELSYNDIRKNLTLPIKPSKELAEFIGILIGDGYIGYYEKYNNRKLEMQSDNGKRMQSAGQIHFDSDNLSRK